MREIIQYEPNYWKVVNDGVITGWIDLTDEGKYNARSVRPSGHKGGICPLIGTFNNFEDACLVIP